VPSTPTRVVGGALEGSNVDSTATMATMMMVLRAFEAGRQAIQLQNETLGQSVRDIGTTR
jgi:flagellar basal body rod protein FlgG